MLRLRPSELTLTPEDVEHTFRRLAQKQAARASAMAASRGEARQGRPVIRCGPQRSTRAATTLLADNALFGLQPQHATTITVASEDVDDAEPPTSRDTRRDSFTHDSPHVQSLRPEYPAPSVGLRHLQLPFRPGPGSTQRAPHGTSNQAEPVSTPTAPDASQHAASRPIDADPASRVRESGSSSPPVTPTDNYADLRGGAGGERPCRSHHIGDRVPGRTSSSLQQAHRLESPLPSDRSPDPVKATAPPTMPRPIRYLEGYFKSPHVEPCGISYHFREGILCPQSEPRPRRGREAMPTRSLSSGSALPYIPLASRPDAADTGLMQGLGLTNEPETAQHRSTHPLAFHAGPSSTLQPVGTITGSRQRQRQSSSQASYASAAFSYYGSLPSESRHSSSGMSGTEQPSHSQFDGATASREVGSAVHHRVRSLGVASNPLQSSPNAGTSRLSPDPRPSYSPLPSSPYTRVQGVRTTSQPFPYLGQPALEGDYPDATEAAARDLHSPLDDYSEQYQSLLGDQYAREAMPGYPPQLQSTGHNPNRSRRGSGGDAFRNPYAPLPTMDHQARPQPGPQLSQQRNRTHHAARANQRSSENNPVTTSSINNRAARGQVQTQRAAYELLQNASRAMQTIGPRATAAAPVGPILPSPTSPRDVSDRGRLQGPRQMASRPATRRQEGAFLSSSPPPIHGDQHRFRASAQGTGFGGTLSIPPPSGYGPALQYHEGPQRSQTRTQRQVSTTAAPSLHLQPSRDSPLTSLALDHGSGVTSRRSRSPLARATTTARTHRRVPAHQRDQENSAEAEISAMRREEAAVNARYGGNGQQETMDETPPRVGRFERAMFE